MKNHASNQFISIDGAPKSVHTNLKQIGIVALLAIPLSACGPETANVPLGPIRGTFAVSDYFTPSGHMGDAEDLGFLYADAQKNCKPRPQGAHGYCYHFQYLKRGDRYGWAGVYWVYPANNWGSREGIRIENSLDYKQVRFKAASDVPLLLNFFIGGIRDDRLTYRDRIKGGGSAVIDSEWKVLSVEPFQDPDNPITNLIGAFGWSMRYPDGTQNTPATYPDGDKPVNLYIDDIVWDTEPPPPPDSQP